MLLTVAPSGIKSRWICGWRFEKWDRTSIDCLAQVGGAASIPPVEVGGATSSLLSDSSRSQRKARRDETCRKQRSPFLISSHDTHCLFTATTPKMSDSYFSPPRTPLHTSQFKIFNWKMNITTMKKGHMHKFKTYKKYKRTVLLKSHFKYHFNNKNI